MTAAKELCPTHGCVLVQDLEGSNGGKAWCWTCSQEGGPLAHTRNQAARDKCAACGEPAIGKATLPRLGLVNVCENCDGAF